ncbi:molybdenum ABC transporter ATP-binding protein [Rhodospirillales bacterium 47_12_T64]|nr:molybdenum ABC transporter ATP-binding protein [Rhodospirillales bacterium 47_12_T64]
MTKPDGIVARFSGSLDAFDLSAEFTLPGKGVTALFGKSGCGKTTVLRCLAGLSHMEDSFLSVKGDVWQDGQDFIPTHKRPVGFVFQEASLFAHLTVKDNLIFGQKRAGDRGQLVHLDDIVSLLGLGDFLSRSAHNLSGGERQRVAIGRALLSGPELLLMDEPLAALDRFSKDEIIPYLERLFQSMDIPMIFVSHDMDEVEQLADYMVLMEEGAVLSCGPLKELLADPKLFIARSPKTASVIDGRIKSFDVADQLTELEIEGGSFLVPGELGDPGSHRRVRIAANDVSLASDLPSKTTILNVLPVHILGIHELDQSRVNILLSVGHNNNGSGARFLARITRRSLNAFSFATGQNIYAQVKSASMLDPHKR